MLRKAACALINQPLVVTLSHSDLIIAGCFAREIVDQMFAGLQYNVAKKISKHFLKYIVRRLLLMKRFRLKVFSKRERHTQGTFH